MVMTISSFLLDLKVHNNSSVSRFRFPDVFSLSPLFMSFYLFYYTLCEEPPRVGYCLK